MPAVASQLNVKTSGLFRIKPCVLQIPGDMKLIDKANLIGAGLAHAIYIIVILIFAARLAGKPHLDHMLGLVLSVTAAPLLYLLVLAPSLNRPPLYYIQISLMLAFLVVELLLDYLLKVDFRNVRWMVIAYVMIFFAGSGGMIGVASHAGRGWTISAVVLFLLMGVLAFVQRLITGF
jgi:hypothetical protein